MQYEQLTGPEKAAILILSIDPGLVSGLLSRLENDEIERLLAAVSRFEEIPPGIQDRAVGHQQGVVGRDPHLHVPGGEGGGIEYRKAEPAADLQTLTHGNADGKRSGKDGGLDQPMTHLLPGSSGIQAHLEQGIPFHGPVGLEGVRIVADPSIQGRGGFVLGANETDYHYVGAEEGRDFKADLFADLSPVLCVRSRVFEVLVRGQALSSEAIANQESDGSIPDDDVLAEVEIKTTVEMN